MHGGTLSYPQATSRSGEHRNLPHLGLGEPQKRFLDILYAILCDFTCALVHFGNYLLRIITPKVGLQENITAVGKVMLHVWSSNWGAAVAEALNK